MAVGEVEAEEEEDMEVTEAMEVRDRTVEEETTGVVVVVRRREVIISRLAVSSGTPVTEAEGVLVSNHVAAITTIIPIMNKR